MTHNSIQYMANLEDKRHNLVQERETARHNYQMEQETQRSDLANEAIGLMNAEANQKNAETNKKNAKSNRIQAKAAKKNAATNAKEHKTNVKNSRTSRAYTKRQTEHIGTQEAIDWGHLDVSKFQAIVDKNYKEGMVSAKHEKNAIARDKNYQDLMIKALQDPKVLAWVVASGRFSKKDAANLKYAVTDGVKNAIESGANLTPQIVQSYITKPLEKVFGKSQGSQISTILKYAYQGINLGMYGPALGDWLNKQYSKVFSKLTKPQSNSRREKHRNKARRAR